MLKRLDETPGGDGPAGEDLAVLEEAVREQGQLVRQAKQRAKEAPSEASEAEVRPSCLANKYFLLPLT